jgi:hypothetical protein
MNALAVLLLLFTLLQSEWQEPSSHLNTNIVLQDRDYAFSISLPQKWALDTTDRALQAAAQAVLYSTEQGKGDWRIVILIATKRLEGRNTLANLVSYWAKFDSSQNVGTVQTDGPVLFTRDRKQAIVKSSKRGAGRSSVAYIDDLNVVVVISQWWPIDEAQYQTAFNDFKQVVESYAAVIVDEENKK